LTRVKVGDVKEPVAVVQGPPAPPRQFVWWQFLVGVCAAPGVVYACTWLHGGGFFAALAVCTIALAVASVRRGQRSFLWGYLAGLAAMLAVILLAFCLSLVSHHRHAG
jgi:hypothetical protein